MEFKIDEEIKTLNVELRPAEYNEMKAMAQEAKRITPPNNYMEGAGCNSRRPSSLSDLEGVGS
jgi:hypothetical protein